MIKYICIKSFKLPYFDENLKMTDEYGVVKKDSLWEKSNEISESDIKLNKICGISDFIFIDITNDTFKNNFDESKKE